jgi:hypothetical protein
MTTPADTARALRGADYSKQRTRDLIPASGFDVDGAPDLPSLASDEQRARLGILPRRSLWPEVDQLGEAIAEAERRQVEATAEQHDLQERRRTAPNIDARAMAEWIAGGEHGERPASLVLDLDRRIVEAEAARDGAALQVDRLLQQRANFVAKHRDRLANVAAQQRELAHRQLLDLLDQVAAARDRLSDLRQAEVWAKTWPDDFKGTPNTSVLCGGYMKPVKETLGVTTKVAVGSVVDVLRLDADFLAAMGPPAMRGPDSREAVWLETPAGRTEHQQRLQEAMEAFAYEHGRYPDDAELEFWIQTHKECMA